MKIYLSPSKQTANIYAAGNTNEQTQCNLIAAAAEKALLRCGFDVKRAPEGQEIEESVRQSNAWGADMHIPIHTNAGGGKGPVVFVSSFNGKRKAYGQAVYDALNAIVPYQSSYGVRVNSGLYEVKHTTAMCLYVECEFHDNAELARWIIANTGAIGEAIAKGVCSAVGIKYIPAEQKVVTAGKYFTDTVGNWAEAAIDFCKEQGLMTGVTDTTFEPDRKITRAEIAVILRRLMNKLA